MDPLIKILIVILIVFSVAGVIVGAIASIVGLHKEIKNRRMILLWKWRRSKVQGHFLIKQWDAYEFFIYELKFSWRFGYHWHKLDYAQDQERAERTLRCIIERKRQRAGLPRIYDFEGRLI